MQDYHRFHFPVSGVLASVREVPGKLMTVNPIAVNSSYPNVFTENKRSVAIIETEEFGDVAFVAIGATMVGSIVFTAETGWSYRKGEEMGYFQFGGSTVVAVFQEGTVAFDEDLLSNRCRMWPCNLD
jgi:phosphatidylserine decarboxylase